MSKHTVSIDINGTTVTKEVDSRMLLIHFIREELQMTGTHIGCCLLYTSPSPRDRG